MVPDFAAGEGLQRITVVAALRQEHGGMPSCLPPRILRHNGGAAW